MPTWPVPDGAPPGVDERVVRVLSESGGEIAFNGLRRALGVHPESLVRALRRLERNGRVRRGRDGYSLEGSDGPRRAEPAEPRQVASIQLPGDVDVEDLLGRLAGRWFGPMRWVGVFERDDRPYLAWSDRPGGSHLFLSVRQGHLEVLTDRPSDDSEITRQGFDLLSRALSELTARRSLPTIDRAELRDRSRPLPAVPN